MSKNLQKYALVAMAIKLPGANDLTQFWDILRTGKETISSFSTEQSINAGSAESFVTSKFYRPYRGVLEHLDDCNFSPIKQNSNDLKKLSIQGKVISYLTRQALSSMIGNNTDLIKNTAVYIGMYNHQLSHEAACEMLQPLNTSKIIENYYLKTIAPYISYEYGFEGAAIDLYTACSSSAVAVIQACQELSLHQCDMAIAGGVSIHFPQEIGYIFEKDGILSEDGHCRPFDSESTGTVMSNGAGVIVLKRYEDAVANNDLIHAVITGYGINNDSNLKARFIEPGVSGQYLCIRSAWARAGIQVNDIDYIEAHGTATSVGDAVEMLALQKAFKSLNREASCPVGSVKSNIGHTFMASGLASIIKTSLMLQHQAIVPSINFQTLNPNIFLGDVPLYIPTSYQKFPETKKHYTAAVSNFGLGGTNTHIVLQSAF